MGIISLGRYVVGQPPSVDKSQQYGTIRSDMDLQDYLGDDDEGNPIIIDREPIQIDMGDDDEGNAIIVVIP